MNVSKFWKVVLSVALLFVVMLSAAAMVELQFGEQRPGLAQLIVFLVMGPALWLIWRKRPDQA